jgi:hypothetical protein
MYVLIISAGVIWIDGSLESRIAKLESRRRIYRVILDILGFDAIYTWRCFLNLYLYTEQKPPVTGKASEMIESKTPEKCMFEWQLLGKGSSTLFLRSGMDFRLLPIDERKRLKTMVGYQHSR